MVVFFSWCLLFWSPKSPFQSNVVPKFFGGNGACGRFATDGSCGCHLTISVPRTVWGFIRAKGGRSFQCWAFVPELSLPESKKQGIISFFCGKDMKCGKRNCNDFFVPKHNGRPKNPKPITAEVDKDRWVFDFSRTPHQATCLNWGNCISKAQAYRLKAIVRKRGI